jgi:hypothetical protein
MHRQSPGAFFKFRSQLVALRVVRLALWFHQALRDSSATARFARTQGFRTLDATDRSIFEKESASTLFILGSGFSVNSMKASQFSEIRTGSSVGVNFWFFHEFIPDAYSFDAGRVPETDRGGLTTKLQNLGAVFRRREIVSKAPAIIILRPHHLNAEDLIPVPRSLSSRIRVSGRANFLSASQADLALDIRLISEALLKRRVPRSILPDNGASVVRLVFLGLAQRFKDIVLVGVDLDDSPHFWDNDFYREKYGSLIESISPTGGLPHATTLSENRALGNREFIELLSAVSRENFGTKLWVSSESSSLYPRLPLFPWGAKG